MKLSTLLVSGLFLASCSHLFHPPQPDEKPTETPVTASDEPKRRLLLLQFLNRTPYDSTYLNHAIWDETKNLLSDSPQFAILTQEDFPSESFPHTPESSDYNYNALFEFARLHGISGVIGGVVEDLMVEEDGDEIGIFRSREYEVAAKVQLRLLDTKNEHEVFNKEALAELREELTTVFGSRSAALSDPDRVRTAVQRAANKLIEQLRPYLKRVEWIGRIAKIDLHRYYINAGETSGIHVGQLLKVFGEGQPVRDDSTKVLLGIAPGPFKGILKVVDYFGGDGAVAVIHSGAGFRERDRVEILSSPKSVE